LQGICKALVGFLKDGDQAKAFVSVVQISDRLKAHPVAQQMWQSGQQLPLPIREFVANSKVAFEAKSIDRGSCNVKAVLALIGRGNVLEVAPNGMRLALPTQHLEYTAESAKLPERLQGFWEPAAVQTRLLTTALCCFASHSRSQDTFEVAVCKLFSSGLPELEHVHFSKAATPKRQRVHMEATSGDLEAVEADEQDGDQTDSDWVAMMDCEDEFAVQGGAESADTEKFSRRVFYEQVLRPAK